MEEKGISQADLSRATGATTAALSELNDMGLCAWAVGSIVTVMAKGAL